MTPAKLQAVVDLDAYAAHLAAKQQGEDPTDTPSADPASDLAYLASL